MSYHFGLNYDAVPVLQPTPQHMSISPASQHKFHQLTPPRRWLGRIEKPRSVRTSPSALDRVRGWPASAAAGRQLHPWQLQALLGASQPSAFPDSSPMKAQQQFQQPQRQYQRPLSWHPTSLPALGAQSIPQNTHHINNNFVNNNFSNFNNNSNAAYHLPGPGMHFPPPVSSAIMSPAPSMAYSPDPFLLPATPPLICSDSAMYSTATSANVSPNWQLQMQHQPQPMMMAPNIYQLPSPAVSLNQQQCWEQKPAAPQPAAQPVQQHHVQPVQQVQQVHLDHVQPQELLLRTPRVLPSPPKPAMAPAERAALPEQVIDLTQDNDDEADADGDEVLADAEDENAVDDAEEAENEDGAEDDEVDRSDVVLVGLGLYDPPGDTFGQSGLQLITEAWQPPPESASSEDDEAEEDA